jgi:hypothetical protein
MFSIMCAFVGTQRLLSFTMYGENYAKIISVFVYLPEENKFKDVHKNSASFAAKLNCLSDGCTNFPRTKTERKKQAT